MKCTKKLTASVLTSLILTAICAPAATATTLARLSLAQMAHAADSIVRVRCLSASSQWEAGTIWTFTEFRVLEHLKGAPPAHIRVRMPGGRVGHVVATVEAAPKFLPGEETVLFLEITAAGDYAVTAWAEGTFRIHPHSGTGEPSVTQESSRFAVFDPAAGHFHTEGIRDLTLNEFRERLAAALAQPAPETSRRAGIAIGSRYCASSRCSRPT